MPRCTKGSGAWLERAAGTPAIGVRGSEVSFHLEQASLYLVESSWPTTLRALRAERRRARLGRKQADVRRLVMNKARMQLISRAVALLRRDDPLRVELVPNVQPSQAANRSLAWAD